MSRYSDYDDYDGEPEQILAMGRWERNSRAVLKSRRGRKALAELREALMALPEHRLIEGALCTVGGVDKRLPAMTDAQVAAKEAEIAATVPHDGVLGPGWPRRYAEMDRRGVEEGRERLAEVIGRQGEGVCAIGAFLWYRKVREGATPDEAFGSLPLIYDGNPDGGDGLRDTAQAAEDAGVAYTLAWELAYKNDETYRDKTPEERHTAFVAWIDKQLATEAVNA
jgi:hypothetical protein